MTNKYNITCVFEDGATSHFLSSGMETVYSAALRSGLTLETDCREGACGVCKAYRTEGDCDIGDISDEALTDEEQEEGFLLSCQARPRSDMVLEFAYPMSLLNKEVATLEARVAILEKVSDNVMRLVLESDAGPLPFLAGQYVNLTVPGAVPGRSYSFANSPADNQHMEFFVRLLDEGAMSNWLREGAKVGDTVQVQGAYGQFFLRPPRAGRIVMVAGGTGLAPMLSMLAQLQGSGQPMPQVTLLYGANFSGELFGDERVAALGDQVTLYQVVVTGDDDWQGKTGFVTDLLQDGLLDDPAGTDAYLCGPPPMIDAAREKLAALGVPPARTFAEKFLPAAD